MLDRAELGALLRRGRPDITDREVRGLFVSCDRDGSGKVSFDEFVDFIFAPPQKKDLPRDARTPLFSPSVKSIGQIAERIEAHDVPAVELWGATFCEELNGVYVRRGFVKRRPYFTRREPPCNLFFGWTEGRRRIGWFLSEVLCTDSAPVREYDMFNPSPCAATPDLCCAAWETAGANRDKRMFCELMVQDDNGDFDSFAGEDGLPECREDELWDLQAQDEANVWDEEEEAGWAEDVGEDLEDFEGGLGNSHMFDWASGEDHDGDGAAEGILRAISGPKDQNAQFFDEEFPTGEEALGSSMGFDDDDRSEYIADKWMRISEVNDNACLFCRIAPDDISLGGGAASSWWLYSACAVVAEYPAWVQSIFGQTLELVPTGKYSVRLYHPGKSEFVRVTIDDFVPTNDGKPSFAGLTAEGEIWVGLVEKAFAKLCGSYAKIGQGSNAFGMFYLCGKGVERWSQSTRGRWQKSRAHWMVKGGKGFDEDPEFDRSAGVEGWLPIKGSNQDAEHIWTIVRGAVLLCYPVACSVSMTITQNVGLQTYHAYSLISAREVSVRGRVLRMVFLRNPFGRSEWCGRWSNESETWAANPAARAVLRFRPTSDGTFWMSYRDFVKYFDKIEIVPKSMPAQGCHRVKLLDLKARLDGASKSIIR
eukprot:TRINITY_DN49256_c0_g1_i1.p1 TRINITY_DN49256_c0_g1~~TRINITY_DN49256_c0_g1_i1.p1  ORF type:complete len:699 (-),score=114.86 TRINITY_DN49256_c0_g1_i1:293-2239(-)